MKAGKHVIPRSPQTPGTSSHSSQSKITHHSKYVRDVRYTVMPAGLSWARYLTFTVSALASMSLGASIVHNYYKPNLVSSQHIFPKSFLSI